MPHCIIEHSNNFEASILNKAVHQGALASDLFESTGSDIKVRSQSFEHYITGEEDLSFIHVTMKILSGRTNEQKSMLTNLILEALDKLGFYDCSISVEVVDIDKSTYAKVIT